MGRAIAGVVVVWAGMSQNPPEKPPKPARKRLTAAELREQRLAEALRANLRRRKATRSGDATPPSGKPEPDGE
jgi:hypothetical protein